MGGRRQQKSKPGTAADKSGTETVDTAKNTHLKVLDHTPKIYIDKAGANDREIVMSRDVAYLAMNKGGTLSGNYHGLGAEIMKVLPTALEDPLYIVKQKNGRIAAVTEIVVTDTKPNYLQNTILGGEIVYNKNNEDPAHFILRLKSLEKAVPTYDLTRSSNSSISHSNQKINPSGEKNSILLKRMELRSIVI